MIHEGRVLNGRYRLTRPLGQGSQAFVWVAEHLALGSTVAVKLIDPELAKKDDARERFRREATAAAKLRSAHVVQIIDHGIDDGQPFIAMELLEGEDLFQRLERRRRLSLQETSIIITQVARALARAHAAGIIHRDLKPENVFIAPNEDEEIVKVLDFGVAKILTNNKNQMSRTGAGTLIGTPHYMSPEQVKGIGEIDYRSDLWALAVITYQAVTGRLPFDSEGVGDLLIKISLETPQPPSALVDGLTADFDQWFARASAKEPEDRFQSAREMAEALARVSGIEAKSSMVRIEDAPKSEGDLDWGESGPSSGNSSIWSTRALAASEREPETLQHGAPDDGARGSVDVHVEESAPPPPPPSMAGPPRPPPPPRRNDDIHTTLPSAGAIPLWETSGDDAPSSRSAAVRNVPRSTVTGLASPSRSIVPPPELDGSRKRRAVWILGISLMLGAGYLVFTVVRSHAVHDDPPAPAAGPKVVTPAATETPVLRVDPVPSASATINAVDPSFTPKPTARPTASVAPPRYYQSPDEIWVPLPDREIPRR